VCVVCWHVYVARPAVQVVPLISVVSIFYTTIISESKLYFQHNPHEPCRRGLSPVQYVTTTLAVTANGIIDVSRLDESVAMIAISGNGYVRVADMSSEREVSFAS
jgi:hypothetical protein